MPRLYLMSLGILPGFFNDEPDAIGASGTGETGATPPEPPTAENGATEQTVTVEDRDRLKTALTRKREARREMEKQLRELQGKLSNVDLDQYEQLRQEKEQAEARQAELHRKKLEEKQAFDELLKLEKENAQKQIDEYQRQQSELRQKLAQIQESRQSTAITNEFLSAWTDPAVGGNPGLKKQVLADVKESGLLRYNEEANRVEVVKNGVPLVNDYGEPLSVKEYFATQYKQEFPATYLPDQRSGTGASPLAAGGSQTKTGKYDDEAFKQLLRTKGTTRAQLLNPE